MLVPEHKPEHAAYPAHAAVAVTVLGAVGQEVVHIRNLVRQLLKLAAAMSAEHAQVTEQEA